MNKKIVMICTAGSRTGGPEASFQLINEINEIGFFGQIWLVTPHQIALIEDSIKNGKRIGEESELLISQSNIFDEYSHYNYEIFDGKFDSDTRFILAEKYLHLIPYFLNCHPVIWWLSVDNAFQSLAKINVNFLRIEKVKHLHQSEYARNFLSALGIKSLPVYDYTVIDENILVKTTTERPMRLALNAGRKVIYPLKRFAKQLMEVEPDLEVILLHGLERQEVYNALKTSRLFYDMGSFPGNDRMYREAASFRTPVMALRVAGASSGSADALPDLYRPQASEATSTKSIQTVLHILRFPELHLNSNDILIQNIMAERTIFRNQVMSAFLGS